MIKAISFITAGTAATLTTWLISSIFNTAVGPFLIFGAYGLAYLWFLDLVQGPKTESAARRAAKHIIDGKAGHVH